MVAFRCLAPKRLFAKVASIMQVMGRKLQLPDEPVAIAARIQAARQEKALTLKEISKATGIDVGQISRFARGDFKRESRNLQELQLFLQISTANTPPIKGTDDTPDALLRHVGMSWLRAGAKRDDYAAAIRAIDKLVT